MPCDPCQFVVPVQPPWKRTVRHDREARPGLAGRLSGTSHERPSRRPRREDGCGIRSSAVAMVCTSAPLLACSSPSRATLTPQSGHYLAVWHARSGSPCNNRRFKHAGHMPRDRGSRLPRFNAINNSGKTSYLNTKGGQCGRQHRGSGEPPELIPACGADSTYALTE